MRPRSAYLLVVAHRLEAYVTSGTRFPSRSLYHIRVRRDFIRARTIPRPENAGCDGCVAAVVSSAMGGLRFRSLPDERWTIP
jgi:hypothetical protein